VKAGRDVGHRRTQPLAGKHDMIDRRRRRKNAGKECVQGAAIVGVVGAGIRMRAAVVMVSVGAGMADAGMMMMTGWLDGRAASRMRLRQRRRDHAGKLGGQKQRDQNPNRERFCAEPFHGGIVGRSAASVNPACISQGDTSAASLGLASAHGIGHDRAALAERFLFTDRGIVSRLMLDLGIQLGAEQHHDGGDP
jgi:hypothetical protein